MSGSEEGQTVRPMFEANAQWQSEILAAAELSGGCNSIFFEIVGPSGTADELISVICFPSHGHGRSRRFWTRYPNLQRFFCMSGAFTKFRLFSLRVSLLAMSVARLPQCCG